MKKFKFYLFDVWGNEVDGFEVNDVYPSLLTFEIADNATDDEVISGLASDFRVDGLELIWDDETSATLYDTKQGFKPFGMLQSGEF